MTLSLGPKVSLPIMKHTYQGPDRKASRQEPDVLVCTLHWMHPWLPLIILHPFFDDEIWEICLPDLITL